MIEPYTAKELCCPRFSPTHWNGKELKWKGKLFMKERVTNFFRSSPNFEQTLQKARDAGALHPQLIMLSDENALWSSDVYVAVKKEVPGAEMVKISGTFLSRVFEGQYKNAEHWMREMEDFAKSKGKGIKRMFFFYTECPKCSKTRGKEYTAILAEVD